MLKISTLALVATLGFALPALATEVAAPAKAPAHAAKAAHAEKAAPAKAAKHAKKSAKKEAAAPAAAPVAAEPAYVAPAINGHSK